MGRKDQPKGPVALRVIATLAVLGGVVYTAYQLWKNTNDSTPNEAHVSNILKPRKKQRKDASITLVVSEAVCRKIEEYNEKEEFGINLQEYMRYYPKLTIVLYPGIAVGRVSPYFEIDSKLMHRIIHTTKEESVFHIAKHLNSSVNLFNFSDFQESIQDINHTYHLDEFLMNLTDMKDGLITDFI